MAATNYTPISLYYSATATNVPLAANLVAGELAINTNDGKLFYKDSSGVVQVMASKAGSVNVSSFSAGTTGFTPNTATTGAVTLAGTLATTNGGTGLTSFTANGVVYASSSSALATGSALVFDGTNLGVGVTPSAWTSTFKAFQVGAIGSLVYNGSTDVYLSNNYASIGGASKYITTAAATLYQQGAGVHAWYNAPSGTAGNTITFTQAMTLDASGNLGIGITSPSVRLAVSDASNANNGTMRLGSTANGVYGEISNKASSTGQLTLNSVGSGASDGIAFQIEGSTKALIDSSGNLGLGVTPSAWGSGPKVMQMGSSGAYIFGDSVSLQVGNNSYFNGTNYIYKNTAAASDYYQFQGSHVWRNAPSGTAGNAITFTQAMTLDASGNLGVGTTSPTSTYSARLAVVPASGAAAISIDAASGNNTGINFYNNGTAKWTTQVLTTGEYRWYDFVAGSERARIDSSGNFGIGTTSPSDRVHAYSNVADVGIQVQNNTHGSFLRSDATGTQIATNSATKPIYFYVGAAERARIDSSGTLLVGKTASAAASVGFQVDGTGALYTTKSTSTSADATYYLYSTGASAYRFYVDMGGTVHATSVVITAISDQRLKENVRDIDTGLDAIMALKPRRFDWKEGKGQDKKNAAGFIADEFETVFPECVGVSKAGGDGIEYKNINHETLIPTLVKAIQEQQAIIESLTQRIATLEAK